MHGVSRAVAPALGRLARVASRRGSPLGHLRSTSRARSRSASFTSMSCLTFAAFVVVSIAPANGGSACVCALGAWRVARRRSGPRPCRSRRVSSRLPTRTSSVHVARALAPRPSARASSLSIAAFVIVFITPVSGGAVLARLLSMHVASRAIVTVAAFVVVSLAPANGGAACACALDAWRVARRRSGPWPSRSRRVSSRLPTRPSSVDVARGSLRCLRLWRRVSQSRLSWSFISHPPMAVLSSHVCS